MLMPMVPPWACSLEFAIRFDSDKSQKRTLPQAIVLAKLNTHRVMEGPPLVKAGDFFGTSSLQT